MKKPDLEPTPLDKAKDEILVQMESYPAHSDEYSAMADQYEKLSKCTPEKAPPLVRADTIVTVIGNLCGIFAVLGFEHGHVITSKALNFIIKPKP